MRTRRPAPRQDSTKNISILIIKRVSCGGNTEPLSNSAKEFSYLPSFAPRLARRETRLEPVFLCRMPFDTPRMISGSATFNAAWAADLSPLVMASSTLRMKPRTRVLRAVLIALRLAVVRTRFLDEAILGMSFPAAIRRRAYTPAGSRGQMAYLSLKVGFRFSLKA